MKVIICLGISLNGKPKPVFIEYEFSMTILVHCWHGTYSKACLVRILTFTFLIDKIKSFRKLLHWSKAQVPSIVQGAYNV